MTTTKGEHGATDAPSSAPGSATNAADRIAVVCISDTHNTYPDIPGGDILIHSGDLTHRGTVEEVQAQLDWLASLPHAHKIVIAGNHDKVLDPTFVEERYDIGTAAQLDWQGLTYLCCETASVRVRGRTLTVYGDPRTPVFGRGAYQYPRKKDVWHGKVPANVDIVVSHGPPRGYRDDDLGCVFLLREIWRARPRLVVCGHIHEQRGQAVLDHDDKHAWARDRKHFGGTFDVFGSMARLMGHKPKGEKTTIVNAASLGPNGKPREDPKEAEGIVVYL